MECAWRRWRRSEDDGSEENKHSKETIQNLIEYINEGSSSFEDRYDERNASCSTTDPIAAITPPFTSKPRCTAK